MIVADQGDVRAASRLAATGCVGMVGAGQLARMTHRAAIDLGVHLEVLARRLDDPAVLAGAPHRLGEPDDLDALAALASSVSVVTLDHELVPNELLVALAAAGHRLHPGPSALLFAQDKLHARRELGRLGFDVPAHREAGSVGDVAGFAGEHGWPVVLKARSGGYDGRGVWVVHDEREVEAVLAAGASWLVEEHVALETELAVLAVRRPSGDHVVYPLIETFQRDGICRELVMPARVGPDVAAAAVDLGTRLVGAIGAVGVVAVELFLAADGRLLVNELALRPHNSGHASIEGCATSQFHNHLRAVLDWPLGDTSLRSPAVAMVNLLGGEEAPPRDGIVGALAVPDAHVHLYGKEPRPGRKIGHVTALGGSADAALTAARTAADRLVGA